MTGRLVLHVCTDVLARSALGDGGVMRAVTGARPAPEWPSADGSSYLRAYAHLVGKDPSIIGWGPWLIVTDGMVVGEAGFKGKPAGGSVEIGYGVAPGWRRRGIATEAVSALIDLAFTAPDVDVVVACCRPDNHASIKVLERAGLARAAGPGSSPLLRWESWKRR